jgi:hypothetical protein
LTSIVYDAADAVQAGLDFLADSQLPNGAFRTLSSRSRTLEDAEFTRSPFVTALVLHSIRTTQAVAACEEMLSRGLAYLLSECEPPGVWRFFGKGSEIPPDMDDTSCCLAVLKELKAPSIDFCGLCDFMLRFRHSSGLFYTWMGVPHLYNDVDPIVNANALFLYSLVGRPLADVARRLTALIREMVLDRSGLRSPYYLSPSSLLYSLCKVAGACEPNPLADAEPWMSRLLRGLPECSDALDSAMMLNASIHLDIEDRGSSLAASILRQQNPDGSWGPVAFFTGPQVQPPVYFGAAELTTAFCMEALAKFDRTGAIKK